MKAAILWELNKELEIRDDVSLTDLGPGEVHIKVVSSGVCHSDVSAQNGTIPSGVPCVLGHAGKLPTGQPGRCGDRRGRGPGGTYQHDRLRP